MDDWMDGDKNSKLSPITDYSHSFPRCDIVAFAVLVLSVGT